MTTKARDLARFDPFSDLSRRELEQLGRSADELTVPAGEVLVREGGPNRTLFLLVEGEARATVGDAVDVSLGAGDIVGEAGAIDHVVEPATVVATTPLRLFVMSQAQLRDSLAARVTLASRLSAA